MYKNLSIVLCFYGMVALSAVAAAEKPAAPFSNPYLADSSYPVTHSKSNVTSLAGPLGSSRRLSPEEIKWKPVGPNNGFVPMYSAPYPNGQRVIWVGGDDRVAKLDAESMDVLATYAAGGTYYSEDEVRHHIATMDSLDDKGFVEYNQELWKKPLRNITSSFYHLLSRDNELYLPRVDADGALSLKVYGETDATDPRSPIVLRHTWKIPSEISTAKIYSINMTSNGWVVLVLSDGTLIALSRDLSEHHVMKLPNSRVETPILNVDPFKSFVRNGVATDDQGGIYVVTRDYMARVQWTGKKFSLSEADGAWRANYPNERGNGSGTTPGLMGWGPSEDHLVIVADNTLGNNLIAFWRDEIPADWKGLQGFDRRVAGITPVHFGVSKDEQVQVENSAVIYGYGVFFDNTNPVKNLPDQGSMIKQWLGESFSMHVPGHEAKGGAMLRWDPKARKLKMAWNTQLNLVSAICTISSETETLYCWGSRNREWTMEGIDWHTGKSVFHYTLGKSHRYNPMGAVIVIAPNGAVDCGCTGGLGMVRVAPHEN